MKTVQMQAWQLNNEIKLTIKHILHKLCFKDIKVVYVQYNILI